MMGVWEVGNSENDVYLIKKGGYRWSKGIVLQDNDEYCN